VERYGGCNPADENWSNRRGCGGGTVTAVARGAIAIRFGLESGLRILGAGALASRFRGGSASERIQSRMFRIAGRLWILA